MNKNQNLLSVFLIVILCQTVISGTFSVNDMDLCDSAGFTFTGSGYECTGNRKDIAADTVDIEEVFTAGYTLFYDCDGSEIFNITYYNEADENTSDEEYYHRRYWDYTDEFSQDCNGSSGWYRITGFIHDLNSEWGDYIETNLKANVSGTYYHAPQEQYKPQSEETVNDIPGNLKIYKPFPKDYENIVERGFMSISGAIFDSYFNQSIGTDRPTQENYLDDTCENNNPDGFCKEFPSASDMEIYSDSNLDGVEIIDTWRDSGEDLGSGGQSIQENITAPLLYHFNHTKNPIFLRTSIEWFYTFAGGLESFRGFYYGFVLLGMYNNGSDWLYWIQYPQGDKRLWTENVLIQRWGYDNNFYGYTAQAIDNSPALNDARFDVISDYTGNAAEITHKNETLFSEGIIYLEPGINYYFNVSGEGWYYQTENPDMRVDFGQDGTYEFDWFGQNDSISPMFNESDGTKIQVQWRGKSGYDSFNYTIIYETLEVESVDQTPLPWYSLEPSWDRDTTFPVSLDLDVTATMNRISNLTFSLANPSGEMNKSTSQIIREHDVSFSGSTLTEGDPLNLTARSYSHLAGDKLYDYGEIDYNYPQFYHYPIVFKPFVPSRCYKGMNCTVYDDESLSDFGSYSFDNTLGDQYYEWYNVTFYDTSFFSEITYFNEEGNKIFYPRGAYEFEIVESDVWDTLGNKTIEICISTLYESTICRNFSVKVEETFGGGGGDNSGAETEEDSLCNFQVDLDYSNQGECMKEMFRFYWIDENDDRDWQDEPIGIAGEFLREEDCTNGACDITLNRSDLHEDDYCSGATLVTHTSDISQDLTGYMCYDTSDYNTGNCTVYPDIGLNEWIEAMGFSTGDCEDETLIEDYDIIEGEIYLNSTTIRKYNLCDEGFLLNETVNGSYDQGYFCYPVEDISLSCEYDCSDHDFDGDGVNDCEDVCCGSDDTINSDGEGLPDGCDPCPFDPDNDADGDGFCSNNDNCPEDYNPDQYDTDGDGYGNVCDICEGGDDDIDSDGDGIPDYCDSDGDGDGDGDGDTGNDPDEGFCSNGVLDSHIGETSIDYGGLCGSCTDGEVSPLIGETARDYGGLCGRCDPEALTANQDPIYKAIHNKTYPFNQSQCNSGESNLILFVFFLILLLMILIFWIFGIPSVIVFLFGVIRFILKRRKKKKEKGSIKKHNNIKPK